MPQDLLNFLPFILPTDTPHTNDLYLSEISRHFKALYGNEVLKILKATQIITNDQNVITKSELPQVIKEIKDLMQLSDHDFCIWEQDGVLKPIVSKKSKENGFEIYRQQKETDTINPHVFLVETKTGAGFNQDSIAGCIFKDFLILFDEILTYVRIIPQDKNFNLNLSRLFNILVTTKNTDKFVAGFINRLSKSKGAQIGASIRIKSKDIVKKIVQELHISPKDMSAAYLSDTLKKVQNEYYKRTNETFPHSLQKLEEYIIIACKYK